MKLEDEEALSMLTIREIEAPDRDQLLALYRQLPTEVPTPAPVDLQNAWQRMLTHPGLFVFVGEASGQIVSSCALAVIPNLTRGARPYGLIENVVTDSAHRRHGYGTTLMKHAISSAWAAGCYKVMLQTGRKDLATLGFYRAVGLESGIKTGFVAYAPTSGVDQQE